MQPHLVGAGARLTNIIICWSLAIEATTTIAGVSVAIRPMARQQCKEFHRRGGASTGADAGADTSADTCARACQDSKSFCKQNSRLKDGPAQVVYNLLASDRVDPYTYSKVQKRHKHRTFKRSRMLLQSKVLHTSAPDAACEKERPDGMSEPRQKSQIV